MRISPLPHQKQGILSIEACGGNTVLADTMGLGKTVQILGAFKRNPSWLPALIVCPDNVKYNWEIEANNYFGIRASICEGRYTPSRGSAGFGGVSPLTVINYDILSSWEGFLAAQKFVTIVFDECHFLASAKSKRTKAAVRLARGIPKRLALSGTPFVNRPIEFYPVLNIVWPKEFPSFQAYAERYCQPKLTRWGWDLNGAANLDELYDRLQKLGMIRRGKGVLNLPPKESIVTPLELSDPGQYKFAQKDFMAWLSRNAAHKVRKVSKAPAMAKVGYLLRLAAKLKLPAAVNRINTFMRENPDKKVVVICVHTKAIEVLVNRLDCKSVVVDGSVTGRDRQLVVEQFQTDPNIRAFIGNIKAAGVGITLTAASRLFFLEMWWNPGAHDQAADRIHRIGQTEPVVIEWLVAVGTIEEKMCKLLQKRRTIITEAIDGGHQVNDDDFNIYEEFIDSLKGGLL